MANELIIKVEAADIERVFASAPERASLRFRELINGAAIDVQRELRIAAPVGASGNLRRAIRYTYNATSLTAEIVPDAPYTEDVEFGTRPHWTSAKPGSSLAKWAKMKGINPYAVQRSIATKGTKAHPFVGPTYNRMKPIIENQLQAGVATFVREINNG